MSVSRFKAIEHCRQSDLLLVLDDFLRIILFKGHMSGFDNSGRLDDFFGHLDKQFVPWLSVQELEPVDADEDVLDLVDLPLPDVLRFEGFVAAEVQ